MPLAYDNRHEIADLTMGELAQLVGALERARTILGNMAKENTGQFAFLRRWPINHEPLRADAKAFLPVLDNLLGDFQQAFGGNPLSDFQETFGE